MKKITLLCITAYLLLPMLMAGGCRDHADHATPASPPAPAGTPEIAPESHLQLQDYLASLNYDWESLEHGVPPFILEKLPEDLGHLRSTRERKRLFFLSLLPMALMINEEISLQREQLESIIAKLDGKLALQPDELDTLSSLADWYRVNDDLLDNPKSRRKLLRRVDIIPPALLLAQAANESAYGTSRFALLANNLFGEWTFTPGTGLVPEDRPEDASYEVRRFPTVMESLKSYVRNLNTHWAYRSLRVRRAELREAGRAVTALELASELELYSTRRQEYVDEIRTIIRYNRLARLSNSRLKKSSKSYLRYLPQEAEATTLQ